MRSVDLSFAGGYDPYFESEVNVAINLDTEGETRVELEEAFLRTTGLPYGFTVEAGQMFTEFGAFNPIHVHDWDWLDAPVVNVRMFGEDGLRGPGLRLGWRLGESPFTLHLGAQNARGETALSFLASDEAFNERGIGGRAFRDRFVDDFDEFIYLARLAARATLGAMAVDAGVSALHGPNATGPGGDTAIYGIDMALSRELSGGRRLQWITEAIYRDYNADADADNGFAADSLEDYGVYSQVLLGLSPRWTAGLRYDYASGDGTSVGAFADRSADPFRADRWRVSPLLRWQFAPTAKLTLQYNYDDSDHLP